MFKNLLIILIGIILFGVNKVEAYYSTDIKKDIGITTMAYKDLVISTDKSTYGMCNKNAEINLTINNPNNYVMNYTLSISDSQLTYTIDGTSSSTYSIIALGTNTHKIVLSGTTSNSSINIIVNATSPYSSSYNKSINLDLVCPVCVFESPSKTTFLNGDTFTYTLTCTDSSGIATSTLASSFLTVSNSSAFSITSITSTSITNGYKYAITAQAGSYNGEASISLKAGMIFDENDNSNVSVESSNIIVENSVTVTFDPNGESVTTNTKVVNYNSAYGELPTPTRTGYKFDGWYTSATGGTVVSSTTIVTNSSAHTLYAHWSDVEAPVCTLTLGSSDVYVGNSTTVILKCTDTGSGIATTTLASSSLLLSSSLGTLSTPTITSIAGGYQYVYTFTTGSTNGSLTFTLDSGKVKDNASNGNAQITSSALTVKKDLKITYKLNGASSFTYSSKTYTSDTTITLCTLTTNTSCSITLPTITASSATPTIIGWSDAASNHTASYSSGGTTNLSSDMTLYAQTRKDSKTYTIKYNTNVQNSDYYSVSVVTPADTGCTISATYNGTSQASSCNAQLTSTLESGLTLSSNWVLMGWSTSSSATSGSQPGATVSLSSNETRYAIWRKTVSVTFKANGCTTSDKTATSYAYNFTKTTSFTVPTVTMNSGWTSLGISSSASTTSQGTSMGSSLSTTIPATEAVADHYYNCKKDLTIYFTHNSCVADSKVVDKTIYNGATSTSVTVPTSTINSGWTSTGAAKTATATSGVAMGSSISFSSIASSETTLEAFYTCSKVVTVTFKANSCTTSDKSETITLRNGATSGSIMVPSATMNSGWTSLGTSASASSTSSGTAMGSSMSISGIGGSTTSITRYYNCSKASKSYTLSYSCNNGTGSTSASSCTIPAVYNGATQATSCSVTLRDSSCSKSGYSFAGWGTSSTTHSATAAGTSVSIFSNTTRYAIWYKAGKGYTVSFNCNGGTGSAEQATGWCTTDDAYNDETVSNSCKVTLIGAQCTRSGWTFEGWGTSSTSLSGAAAGGEIDVSSSHTRYAIWKKTFTATFKTGSNVTSFDATPGLNQCSVYNGASSCTITLPTIVPKTGYTSVGWGSSTGLSGGSAAGSTYILKGDVTLYANAKDKTAPSCGTITGAGSSSSWAQSRTVSITCSDSGSGCEQSSYSKTWSSTTSTGYITISDKDGNTRDCPVNVYVDTTKPSCGTITGAGSSSDWAKSRTITVACSDSHSGCTQTSFSNTWSSNTTTGYVFLKDKAGNTASCLVNVYVDTFGPSCGTITGAAGSSSDWARSRTVSITCSDSGSGCTQSSFTNTWAATTTTSNITITDNLGNTRSCPVDVYVDRTAPVCGTITGAGSSSSWATSRTVSVGCSDSHSGCTSSSFSNTWSSSTTTGNITIKDNVGNTKSCPVDVYVDTTDPVCGTITGAGSSSSWATSRTVSVGCSDSHSGCTSSSFSSTWTSTARTSNITIKDNVGNTKTCPVDVYVDTTAPSCGTKTGQGSSSSWATSRTVTVACTDDDSGCSSSTFSRTWTSTTTTSTITIKDNLGNSRNCSVNVYVDATAPTISCTVNSGGTSGVNIIVSASDSHSGLASNPSGTKTITSTTTYTAKDNAGNSNSCKVSVTRSVYNYTRSYYPCSTPTWNSPTTSYAQLCTASGNSSSNSSSYTTCKVQVNKTLCGLSSDSTSTCYKKSVYSRSGCSAYSSSATSTTTTTSCSTSTGTYGKYTCTINSYTYSGSAS